MESSEGAHQLLTVAVINGPNLKLLGIREPQIYGHERWSDIENRLETEAGEMGVKLLFFQSNYEGAIVEFIQGNLFTMDGVVINPAAYTKTGYAILDALTSVDLPFVEVHLSNILARGGWHSESVFSANAVGQIMGFGGYVYSLGVRAVRNHLDGMEKRKHE